MCFHRLPSMVNLTAWVVGSKEDFELLMANKDVLQFDEEE
jgi:hypothetical protein